MENGVCTETRFRFSWALLFPCLLNYLWNMNSFFFFFLARWVVVLDRGVAKKKKKE